jgi:hypothetical protein
VAKAQIGALPLRFERQQVIEACSRHLIGVTPAVGKLVAKIELGVLLATPEGSAVFDLKPGALHRAKHAGLLQILHALRQETFADAKARKLFALKQQNSQAPAA